MTKPADGGLTEGTMKSSERILERTQFFDDEDQTSCKARLLDIREELPKVRKLEGVADVMSSDDAVFIADVLTTATNTHGVNQTFNKDPYYLTKLAKNLVGALTDLEDLEKQKRG